jgi:hypothetical protein
MSSLIAKYNSPKIAKFARRKSKPLFNPTIKWVEYSIDLIEAKKLLQTADFTTKIQLLSVVNKIENKVKYHQNHADFDLQKAVTDLRLARKLLRL